ncbi:DEAD/DEAH box helicase [Corynebacterium lubricantis]|uniref:DEAD/DEAH box helicase n=1 Tax=Corynebacterium lubricantis TaxID=541095 RepID=UPI00037E3AD3|nr:SNF2-related protein [Corynebacterium lubricantis]
MPVSREELDQLLSANDAHLSRISALRSLLTLIERSGAQDVPNSKMTYLTEDADGQTAYLIIPSEMSWPPGLYAFAELESLPDAADKLAAYPQRLDGIPQLATQARDAAPGFFGRLFGGRKLQEAQEAARALSRRLSEGSFQALTRDVDTILGRLDQATRLQESTGVHLLPGPHGTPETYLHGAKRALQKTIGTGGELHFQQVDPTQIRFVLSKAWELNNAPGSEPDLRRQAESALAELARDRAEILLAQLPVDALRSVTNERLRFQGLEASGITTVKQVLESSISDLTGINGIGEQTARRMKAAAQTLKNEAEDPSSTRIGDTATAAATRLVRVLATFDQIEKLGPHDVERRRRLISYAEQIPFYSAGEEWVVATTSEEPLAWRNFNDDIAWGAAQPGLLEPARFVAVGDNTWEDYLTRPAHYQGLLATLLGREIEGGDDLAGDVLDRIRALRLDDTHLTDLHLRGYQSFGARFALVQEKVVLGDEMGLGKTVQALAAAAHLAAQGKSRTLVVSPASVLPNWVREAKLFTDLPVFAAHGTDKEDQLRAWASEGGICVVTFDGARTMGITEVAVPDLLVVDEAHFIKNPAAARTQAVRAIIDAAPHALLMTGTPLENRVEEFAQLISYVAPELITRGMESMNAANFRVRVAPAYLRRNQSDVLDELPEKLEQTDWIELTSADRQDYERAVEDSNFMGMRRAAMTTLSSEPAKMERIKELVDEAGEAGRNVLIFSYFREVLASITAALGDRVVGEINGSVPVPRRQEMIDELGNAVPGSVLVAQITAGGTGLNIQSASVVILVEPQLKPSIEAQAIARVHRMGQTSTVLVHRLIGEDTVDERLTEMLAGKQEIFDVYARPSESASTHDAVDISEAHLAAEIMKIERKRLGFVD